MLSSGTRGGLVPWTRGRVRRRPDQHPACPGLGGKCTRTTTGGAIHAVMPVPRCGPWLHKGMGWVRGDGGVCTGTRQEKRHPLQQRGRRAHARSGPGVVGPAGECGGAPEEEMFGLRPTGSRTRRRTVRDHRRRRLGGGQGGLAGRPPERQHLDASLPGCGPRDLLSTPGGSPARWPSSDSPPTMGRDRSYGADSRRDGRSGRHTGRAAAAPPAVKSDRFSPARWVARGDNSGLRRPPNAGDRCRRPPVRGARGRGDRVPTHGQLGHHRQRVRPGGPPRASPAGIVLSGAVDGGVGRGWSVRGRVVRGVAGPSYRPRARGAGGVGPPEPPGGRGRAGRAVARRSTRTVVAARCRGGLHGLASVHGLPEVARAAFESVAWEVDGAWRPWPHGNLRERRWPSWHWLDPGRDAGVGRGADRHHRPAGGTAAARARPRRPEPHCWPRPRWARTTTSMSSTPSSSGPSRTVRRRAPLCRAPDGPPGPVRRRPCRTGRVGLEPSRPLPPGPGGTSVRVTLAYGRAGWRYSPGACLVVESRPSTTPSPRRGGGGAASLRAPVSVSAR